MLISIEHIPDVDPNFLNMAAHGHGDLAEKYAGRMVEFLEKKFASNESLLAGVQ